MSDTRTVRLSEAAKYLKLHFKAKRPAMIWGPPGIGKSDLVATIVDNYADSGLRAKLIDVRLPLWEPTDIKGVPYYNPSENTMSWAHPTELPNKNMADNYDIIVLFLDELNGAAPSVQAAAYQLVLNRRVGEYVLPDNVVVVAAGNRDTDKGVTYRMPKPLSNRFVHYEVRVDFNDWVNWATDHAIHPDVVGFLTHKKASLYDFDPKSNDRSFATPRSWSFVSELLYDVGTNFSDEEITDMVSGCVGEATALEFKTHRAISSKLPNPTHILHGTVTELVNCEISAKYSLATSLAYELKAQYENIGRTEGIEEDAFDDMLNNSITFMMKNFDAEMVIMSIRMLFTQYKVKPTGLRKLPCWPDFMKEYGELIKLA